MTYDVVIAASGSPYNVFLNANPTIDSLTLNASDATFQHPGTRLLTLRNSLNVSAGTYRLAGRLQVPLLNTGPNATFQAETAAQLFDTGNSGTINVLGSASLTMNGTWSNASGTINNVGRLRLDGSFSRSDLGQINNAGFIEISGTLDNLNSVLAIDDSNGGWSIGNLSNTSPGSGIINGGKLMTSGAAFFSLAGRGELNDVENLGRIEASSFVVNRLINRGTLTIRSAPSSFTATDLVNTGTIDVLNRSELLLNGTWSNSGTLNVVDSTIRMQGTTHANQIATIRLQGASTVQLSGTVQNAGNTIQLTGPHDWQLVGGKIVDGALVSSVPVLRVVPTAPLPAEFSHLSLGARVDVDGSNNALRISDGLTFLPGGQMNFTMSRLLSLGDQLIGGTGTIALLRGRIEPTGTLTIGSSVTIHASASDATIGMAQAGASVVNQGRVLATANDGALFVTGGFRNDGTIEAASGGSVRFSDVATMQNISGSTLLGGTWVARAGSNITFPEGVAIRENRASVVLDGVGSEVGALQSLERNVGSFALSGGRDFTTADELVNEGLIELDGRSTLASDMFATSHFTQTLSGELQFVLGGAGVEQFGQLHAAGAVGLQGKVVLRLAPGYEPVIGDAFQLISASTLIADGVIEQLPSLSGEKQWEVTYGSSTLVASVVPEPTSAGFLCALLVVGARRRRQLA